MHDLITTKQLARRLSLSPQTLTNWRAIGSGPPFKKLGKAIRYAIADVIRWMEGKR